MRSLGRAIKKFSADDMLVYAAALSYQLFFSLFPFVIFLLALLGVLTSPASSTGSLSSPRRCCPDKLRV
jgi:uncharacterized BrkB/YihY/UPF0761 family membrane protein